MSGDLVVTGGVTSDVVSAVLPLTWAAPVGLYPIGIAAAGTLAGVGNATVVAGGAITFAAAPTTVNVTAAADLAGLSVSGGGVFKVHALVAGSHAQWSLSINGTASHTFAAPAADTAAQAVLIAFVELQSGDTVSIINSSAEGAAIAAATLTLVAAGANLTS